VADASALRAAAQRGELSQSTADLERRIGHDFARKELLAQALIHSSAAKRGDRGNERLEFLGDRVLGLIVAERLVERFPNEPEGDVAKRYAHLVDATSLARIAGDLDLGRFLVFAKGDEATENRRNPGVLADALEAVIAALYLDAGLERARAFVLERWNALIEESHEAPRDAKTTLQEWALGRALGLPRYTVLRHEGPAHKPTFEVAVEINGHPPCTAEGPSKRAAEHAAAALLLNRIGAKT
jgi:ribonuclease-3